MNRWNPSNSPSFLQDVTDAMTLLHAEAEAEGVEVNPVRLDQIRWVRFIIWTGLQDVETEKLKCQAHLFFGMLCCGLDSARLDSQPKDRDDGA